MAVAFDAVGPSSAGTGTSNVNSINWSHTCTGSNRLLVVGVGMGGPSARTLTATYNSVSMTSAGKVNSNNQTDGYVEMFYLVAPATGSNTVVVTIDSSTVDLVGGSVSFTGVNQSTPLSGTTTAFGSSTTPSVTISSNSGDMVVDAVACASAITSSNQTLRWNKNLNNVWASGNAAQSTADGAGSVNMSYNIPSDWWGIIGTNVVAAAGAPAIPTIAWMSPI